jgi:hypothetical protein
MSGSCGVRPAELTEYVLGPALDGLDSSPDQLPSGPMLPTREVVPTTERDLVAFAARTLLCASTHPTAERAAKTVAVPPQLDQSSITTNEQEATDGTIQVLGVRSRNFR